MKIQSTSLEIVDWTIGTECLWNFNQYTTVFIQENQFENAVYEMAAILSLSQCMNSINSVGLGSEFAYYMKCWFCDRCMMSFSIAVTPNSSLNYCHMLSSLWQIFLSFVPLELKEIVMTLLICCCWAFCWILLWNFAVNLVNAVDQDPLKFLLLICLFG